MDIMLQRHCAKYIYIVPEGLKDLMNDISREVLRSQPENLYTFIADYLDALMITRENARVAARLVQSITEITTTTCEFLRKTGMDRKQVDNVVTVIQNTFKNHLQEESDMQIHKDIVEANIVTNILNEANVSTEKGEEAAKIIQHAFKNFKQRKEKEKELLSGMIDWRVAARSAIFLYRKTGVTNEEANRAATLIKAAYKGYYTRRMMRALTAENTMSYQQEDEAIEETEIEEEEKPLTESMSGSRVVKINYDTVIPHVDFDDKVVLEELTDLKNKSVDSTVSTVVNHAIENIFETTMMLVKNSVINGNLREKMPPDSHTEFNTIETTTVNNEKDIIDIKEMVDTMITQSNEAIDNPSSPTNESL